MAAGKSSRFGSPKQLETWGLSLHIEKMLQLECPISLVLGAHYDKIINQIFIPNKIDVVYNKDYEEGISTSIISGIQRCNHFKNLSVLITLSDMPTINKEHYKKIIEVGQKSQTIVASKMINFLGPPVYFSSYYFQELLSLKDDIGAKMVIKKNMKDVEYIHLNEFVLNVNMPSDLKYL